MPLRYLLWDVRYISRRPICLVSIGAPINTTLIIIISQGSAVLKHFANFCFHLDSLFPRTKTLPHSLLTGNTHTSETAAISTVGIVGSKRETPRGLGGLKALHSKRLQGPGFVYRRHNNVSNRLLMGRCSLSSGLIRHLTNRLSHCNVAENKATEP